MKRSFRGAPRPLLPAMLLVATTNPNAGQEHHHVTQTQPSSSTLPEEASLAEAIRLDTLQKEEVAKQVHLDALLAQRIAEEEELNEQQKKRRAQVQFEAQHYTDEDWDLIRAKIEANAELSINVCLESDLKEKILQRDESWGHGKLSQLKNLSFERSQGKICDISRDDLTELYRIVMNRYGMDGPGEELGSKDHCGRYYDLEEYHCLNLEKYLLSAEICKTMLDKKLQGGKPDEDCYKMLKMMEKQAVIVKVNKRSRTNALKSKLRSIKLGDSSMEAYFMKIESILTTLASLGSQVNDKDVVHYALEGLPTSMIKSLGLCTLKTLFRIEMRLKSKSLSLPVDSSSPLILMTQTGTPRRPSSPQIKSWRPCFVGNYI
ncbi:hypothetical protein Tco_1094789 [Tanacetum coccineum]|uniref:Uncharacterized protein n=1 Tax=Tanacetum coccineum TaxID=301880 RepID=A0ABQ5IGI1_9ASTR